MPESVKRRGSSGPTIGATERSVESLSSMAMAGGYPRTGSNSPGEHVRKAREAGLEVVAAQGDQPRRAVRAAARDARLAQQAQVVAPGRRRDAELLGELAA